MMPSDPKTVCGHRIIRHVGVCAECKTEFASTAETRIQELIDLLRKCQSGTGHGCPICTTPWLRGDSQPHTAGCALAKAIGP